MIIDQLLLIKIGFIERFGLLLVFLAALLEASPFLGLIIPGALVSFFGGFFAKFGLVNLYLVMAVSMLGSILGDIGGYLVGRYFGKKVLHRFGKYLFIKREYIEKSCDVIQGHSGKSLVIGRLNPITRAIAPFVVGANKIRFGRFMVFNIIGGVLYGFLFVALGYIFGRGYEFAAHFERYLVWTTILVILAIYIYSFVKIILDKIKNGN